ncbi:Aspartyl/Asparaginyl beta-hydroxylase [Colwellia chukchiensis]|uniref:Aspartyl/Asparaginyl beta-hydroxylase n=1 Tax=Colwellia chukchiensis TaxID=641665 RepID=A0A1H7GNH3_9GAMM|nr:aspartyl/asparaginyl beta-hydroxylase domain-containing protein [Colwellia chukchiensis]SEK38532.1 Aspartyl/Asparaginyl beta-hydroxylase [Colwellia chukchiensis]
MTTANLLQQANLAFEAQNNQRGLQLLREYTAINGQDVEQLYRLAVIEEQIGLENNAAQAYLKCIALDENFIEAYLYAGYFFQQRGELEKALALYSLGQDRDARLTLLYQHESIAYPTRLRSHAAHLALCDHFTQLHSQSIKSNNNSDKIAAAIWPQTHNQGFNYPSKQQQPHLFYIPSLTAKGIHDASDFAWSKTLEAHFEDLSAEFSNLQALIKTHGVPYLAKGNYIEGFEALTGSKNWTALNLYKDGVANEKLLAKMPKTAKMLAQLPLYKMNDNPYEVFFSLLKPGQHITPHFGQSNHSLTVHLPIIVPKGGYLTVAGENIAWQVGKVIVFDDSFEHEAINPTDEDRVVLIFSIWHPELSATEQEDILASFHARAQWLENRHQYLSPASSA